MNTTGNIDNYSNFIVTINQSTKRLARLIDKVLDVTQLENELLILHKENFSLEKLVIEIVREYNNNIHLLNKNQLEIRSIPDSMIVIVLILKAEEILDMCLRIEHELFR